MAARISGIAVAYTTAGFVLLWSGLKNVPVGTELKDFAKGQPPPPNPTGAPTIGLSQAQGGTGGTLPGPDPGLLNQYKGGGTPAENRRLGQLMAGAYGWATGTNWQALDYGWGTLESGWSNTAQNGTWPGAYGIAQADPGTKYPKAGWPAAEGGSSSAVVQIAWGLAYIKRTYGSPSQVPGWLGQGGYQGY
jgi:hypothetical protein